jgi:hypothetical protein
VLHVTLVSTIVKRTLKFNLYRTVNQLPLHDREKQINVTGINVIHAETLRKNTNYVREINGLSIEAVVQTETSEF